MRVAPLLVGMQAVGAIGAAACTPFKEDLPMGTADGSAAPPVNVTACATSMPFDPPIVVPGFSNVVAASIGGLRLSADYRTAYFHASGRRDSLGYDDIYTASRDTPSAVTPSLAFDLVAQIVGDGINTNDEELDPSVSGDGLTLIYVHAAPSAAPRIHYATRTATDLPFVFRGLVANVNGPSSIYNGFPFLREDGQVLYFASTLASGNPHIYRTVLARSGFEPPAIVLPLMTTFNEAGPVVTPDDRTIYFASSRDDGGARGDFDIWMSTRTLETDDFCQPTNVTELNSDHFDMPTFVTRDGCTLYFSSNRSGTMLPYVATRRRGDI